MPITIRCPRCRGSGEVQDHQGNMVPCSYCGAQGESQGAMQLELESRTVGQIPAEEVDDVIGEDIELARRARIVKDKLNAFAGLLQALSEEMQAGAVEWYLAREEVTRLASIAYVLRDDLDTEFEVCEREVK